MINGIAKKEREKVRDVFRKGKFELLALTEPNMKGNGEILWCVVNGIITAVQGLEGLGKAWMS